MCNMLFVNGSHLLSPYIYSLNSEYGNLPDKDRNEINEKLDPSASGGMNGYIALCGGDPCPPVFRSPVDRLEGIMDNQVICSIYKLPDPHKHIARSPAGVIIPKKSVEAGDLKPPPVLWHEDSVWWPHDNNNRRPYDNSNWQNPSGSLSGRQLGEAAHRLVVNSLNVRGGAQYDAPSMPYQTIMNGMNYPNGRHHVGNQGVPPRMEQPAGRSDWHAPGDNMTNGQAAYALPSGHYQHGRTGPSQYERDNCGGNNPTHMLEIATMIQEEEFHLHVYTIKTVATHIHHILVLCQQVLGSMGNPRQHMLGVMVEDTSLRRTECNSGSSDLM